MIQNADAMDWHWTVAFNQRIWNPAESSQIPEHPIGDSSLLPEKPAPVQFKFLRPVAMLVASAKRCSRTCFHFPDQFAEGP